MKKLIALLLAMVMVLSLAACGGTTDPVATGDSTDETTPVANVDPDVAEAEIRYALECRRKSRAG